MLLLWQTSVSLTRRPLLLASACYFLYSVVVAVPLCSLSLSARKQDATLHSGTTLSCKVKIQSCAVCALLQSNLKWQLPTDPDQTSIKTCLLWAESENAWQAMLVKWETESDIQETDL